MSPNTAVYLLLRAKYIRKKEKKNIYIAPFILRIVSKRSDMDHTFPS